MVRNAGVVIVIAIMSMTVAGQAARPQDVELQKAIRTETVEGNDAEAIRLYGAIAAKYGATDRSVTAQALLRQARLYQKHGDARANGIFERIVSQFGDQRQTAAQAQQALGGNRRVTQERVTVVMDDKPANAVSPDGRWVVFASSSGFVIRRNGSTRDHVSVPQGDTPVFSADSRRVAYNHWGKREFHVASLDGAWNPRVVKPTPEGVRYYDPGAWSADGQSVLVEVVHQDWSKEIAWLTLATGNTRVVFKFGHSRPQDQGERLKLSPNGQWIAYSAFPVDPGTNTSERDRDRHIYLLPAQGGTPTEIVGGNINVRPVWTADSRRLAFVSNRSGSFGLWSIPVTGKRESPVIEMPSSGRIVPMAITRDGSLYFARNEDGVELFVSEVRADGRVGAAARLATGESGRNFRPVWSPDGRSIAYLRQRTGRPPDQPVYKLVVHSMPDHSERVFDSNDLAMEAPEWLADGTRVLVTGFVPQPAQRGARPQPLIVNVVTGTVTPAAESERRRPAVRITLPAGTAEEQRATAMSPDGTRSAFVVAKRGTNTGALWIAAADGQGGRQLAASANTRMLVWAADSRAVYFLEPRGDDARLMRVAVDGGAPLYTGVTLPLDRQRGATLAGNQLVLSQETTMSELWVVRKFAGR